MAAVASPAQMLAMDSHPPSSMSLHGESDSEVPRAARGVASTATPLPDTGVTA